MSEPLSSEDTRTTSPTQEPHNNTARFLPLKAARAVFSSRTFTAHERLVLLALISHADRTGVCYPGRALLAQETHISRRSISKALASLAESGVLAWTSRRTARGDHDSNLYRIVLPDTVEVGQPVPHGMAPVATPRAAHAPGVGQPVPTNCPSATDQKTPQAKGVGEPAPAPQGLVKREGGDPSSADGRAAKDWSVFEETYGKMRHEKYGTKGVREHVPEDERAEIVRVIDEMAIHVRDSWNEIRPRSIDRNFAVGFVSRALLSRWFAEYVGTDDYLTRRKHPLRAFYGDLTAVLSDWLEEWAAQLVAERRKVAS